jgi:hypothetical protein
MCSPLRRTTLVVLACMTALLLLAAQPASAQNVTGSIFTTFNSGTTVNGNIYPSKDAVYLNGGPQNQHSHGMTPDGTYYFQVTDPSGAVLLSTDDITCREVVVSAGRIIGIPPGSPSTACVASDGGKGGFHNTGTPDPSTGQTPVQLCAPSGCPGGSPDFLDTPNHGGEYKVWATPIQFYFNCSSGASPRSFGFCDSDSDTDNFKVRPPNSASITACKFIDVDSDATFDPTKGDFLTSGWQITATGVDGDTGSGVTQTTDQDGCTTFTFTFPTGVTTDTVTLTEVLQTGFSQVAPTPVSGGPTTCSFLSGSQVNKSDSCSVTNGVITLTVSPNDIAIAPLFGNAVGANLVALEVSKTAIGGNNFNWTITKSVDKTQIDTTSGTATFNYTVTVTHDAGTGWQVTGNITVTNPNTTGGLDGFGAIDQIVITDNIDNGGTCNVNGTGTNSFSAGTINGGANLVVPYTCTFAQNPVSGNNTVSVAWDPSFAGGGPVSFVQPYDFTAADTSVTVTDSLAGSLGTVKVNNDNTTGCMLGSSGTATNVSNLACNVSSSTATFTYSLTFSGDKAGTCTLHNNTASFATNTMPGTANNSNTVTVRQCVGEDLTLSKTATATFTAGLSKSVNQTTVEQSGGNITFNYKVSLTSPVFQVTGNITAHNPNDWESITANITDTIDSGGICVVTGGTGVVIAAGGTAILPYTCTYTTNPTLNSGTNTANASETSTTDTGVGDPNFGGPGIVPGTPTPGTAGYTFPTLTITDVVQVTTANPAGCTATLGTVNATTTTVNPTPTCGITHLASPSWGVFTYSITDPNSSPGTCTTYTDTAAITGGPSSNTVTVTVCNTGTGALTMGFWKNSNGQKIITGFCGGTSGTSLDMFLRQFNPFQDLSAAATCKQDASYVATVIGAATCGGSTCNPMLRAQMLATALDVYFSTPSLGGNQIGAFNGLGNKTPALGGIAIDLSKICGDGDGGGGGSCPEDARPVFGICTGTGTPVPGCSSGFLGTTVIDMLFYSDFMSSVNGNPVATPTTGASWYLQLKGKQVLAKDVFDAINNQNAPIAPSGVTLSSF